MNKLQIFLFLSLIDMAGFLAGLGALASKAIPSLIGAVGSIGSTLLGNHSNQAMFNKQMKYNTSEREASQAYQTSEREAQNAYSERMYNQYQSPQALVRQYQEAGINPRLAFDAGSAGTMSAVSGSSGSAPAGAMASPPYQPGNIFSTGFMDLANSFKAIAEAKKAGAETGSIEALLGEQLRGIKLSNDSQDFLNSVNREYLNKERAALLTSTLRDIENKSLQGVELRKRLQLLAKENIIQQNVVDTWYTRFQGDMEEQMSRTGVNIENQNLLREKAKSEPALRDAARADAEAQRSVSLLNGLDYDINSATTEEQKNLIRENVSILRKQYDVLSEEANKLRKEGKYYEWHMCNESLRVISDAIVGVMIGRSAVQRANPAPLRTVRGFQSN